MKKFLGLAALCVSIQASAFSLSQEIRELNQIYGSRQSYPIAIVDKEDLKLSLNSQNLRGDSPAPALALAIARYFAKNYKIKLEVEDAFELTPYLVGVNKGASAMPLFVDTIHHQKRACVVLPGDSLASHAAEIRSLLGADDRPDVFKNVDLNKAARLMSSEELQLFSLYHELSHCLDEKYLPLMYGFESDPYAVHRAEAFAETHAQLLLSQRKDLHALGYPRSLLRTLYSKYYGPILARGEGSFVNNIVVFSGGSTYFLATPLLATDAWIAQNAGRLKSMSLSETVAQSQTIVETEAFSKYGFEALRMSFTQGREPTVAHYQKIAMKAPKIFARSYEELLRALSLLDSVDEKMLRYPQRLQSN